MASIPVVVQVIDRDGTTPGPQVMLQADDYIVRNNGRIFLLVENASAVNARTLTIASNQFVGASPTASGLEVPDRAIVIPALGTKLIGPIDPVIHNDSNGAIKLNTSADTDLSFTALKLES